MKIKLTDKYNNQLCLIQVICFLILIALSLGGCSSKPNHEDKQVNIMQHVELAQLQKHGFCEGSKLFSYIETKYYYQFTCSDGRNFMLPKER